jgi:hypothetical protein
MKALIALIALLLILPASLSAQSTDQKSQGLGYLFIGGGTHGMGETAGFGGEYLDKGGLGVGIEAGTGGWTKSDNGNPNWIGFGSFNCSYHFFSKKNRSHAVPFVEGGYTNFFGQDVFVQYPGPRSAGNFTNGYNLGGGIDLFASKHVGARFDVRCYGHGGRILWASFPQDAQFSFSAVRIGLTFR